VQVVVIFTSYSTIALSQHLGSSSGLAYSRPSDLSSHVQPVGIHHNAHIVFFLFHALSVESLACNYWTCSFGYNFDKNPKYRICVKNKKGD
jgi:hypothetical protein